MFGKITNSYFGMDPKQFVGIAASSIPRRIGCEERRQVFLNGVKFADGTSSCSPSHRLAEIMQFGHRVVNCTNDPETVPDKRTRRFFVFGGDVREADGTEHYVDRLSEEDWAATPAAPAQASADATP